MTNKKNIGTTRKHRLSITPDTIKALENQIPECMSDKTNCLKREIIYNTLITSNEVDSELNKLIKAPQADHLFRNVCYNNAPIENIGWTHIYDLNLEEFCKQHVIGQDFSVT